MCLPICSCPTFGCKSLLAAVLLLTTATPAGAFSLAFPGPAAAADAGVRTLSAETRRVADWVAGSHDNRGLPYIILDKADARLFLFDGGGALQASVPALIGAATGDDSVPGIGSRRLAAIRSAERTTPAGRFLATLGHDSSGEDLLWVDYDTAIALHRASDRKPGMTAKSRVDRLATRTSADNRASYGCIGVTTAFYDGFIRPAFAAGGIVYVLPETRTATAEFRIPAAATTTGD
ncbi:L,D-transpeptidase [Sandarakinorhabdus sp. DWP1-3-1]|uniref:L,D-transpeptidase n=1 Tax=Sandarakinorhabdus sp. DWP1-3-1 TaxID=2804627 RepID=UPI003CE66F59